MLVVVALISAIVAVRWTGVHQRARIEAAVKRLEALDQHLRAFSRSRGQASELEIDVAGGRVRKLYGAESASAWESIGATIAETRIAAEKPTRGNTAIPFDRGGASPTYGIRLTGSGSRDEWLVFAGGTGQLSRLETEGQWDATFELLQPTGL